MWAILFLTLPTQPNAARVRVWCALEALCCGPLREGAYLLPAEHAALFDRSQAYAQWRDTVTTLHAELPQLGETEARRRLRAVSDALQTLLRIGAYAEGGPLSRRKPKGPGCDARFSHLGTRVTVEVLLVAFGFEHEARLQRIATVVHFPDAGAFARQTQQGSRACPVACVN